MGTRVCHGSLLDHGKSTLARGSSHYVNANGVRDGLGSLSDAAGAPTVFSHTVGVIMQGSR